MTSVTNKADNAGSSDPARWAVRAGWAAKGVVYLALGWIILQMAFGSSQEQASTTGALQLIAGSTAGMVALYVVAVGLVLYAVGRILEVTTLATPQIETKDKAAGFVMAVVYAALAVTAFGIAGAGGGSSGGGGGQSSQQGTATVLAWPGGQFIVGLVGLGVIVGGAYLAYLGYKEAFLPTLKTGEMSATVRRAAERLGTAAYVIKGAIFALLGFFLVQAAVTYNPDEATGLDGALGRVAQSAWGTWVLAAVAIGLLAYGAFCGVEARYRRLGSSASGVAT